MGVLYNVAIVEEGFGVTFPDFPGCVTVGGDLQDAAQKAEEVLDLHIQGLLFDEEEIPEPTSIDRIVPFAEGCELCRLLVRAYVPGRSTPVTIHLEDDLLVRIDAAVARTGSTRSDFLADAARKALHVT